MSSDSKRQRGVARILTGLPVLFLLFDTAIHLLNIAPVAELFAQLGYSASMARPLGILELICLTLYVIPRTSVLGAVLLTGYLGGAIASHLRAGNYIALLLWGGLYLREERLRALIPLRSQILGISLHV